MDIGIGGPAASIASSSCRSHPWLLRAAPVKRIEPGVLRSGFERGQRLFDGGHYLRRIRSHLGLEAHDNVPVRANQELGEIPLNLSARLRIHSFVRQELIERGDV